MMSFTVQKTLTKCVYYPEVGIQSDVEEVTIDVTYTVTGIKSLYDVLGVAIYTVTTGDDATPGEGIFEFAWSGNADNVLAEAEEKLKQLV